MSIPPTIAASGEIDLDSVSFLLPCRSYLIRANVTRNRRMPVVDEFLLRLLRVAGGLRTSKIQEFFGFTGSELQTVLGNLSENRLVGIAGDRAALSASAADLFEASPDEQPRLHELEPWTEHVWFDLVSRGFVPPPQGTPFRNFVEIAPAPDTLDLSADFARRSFEDGFHDYLRNIKQVRDPDKVGIHSISSIEPLRHGFSILRGRKVLSADGRRAELRLPEYETSYTDRVATLLSALSDAYAGAIQPRGQSGGLNDFKRLTSLDKLDDAFYPTVFLKPKKWTDMVAGSLDSTMPLTFGASYLKRNIIRFMTSVTAAGGTASQEVVWLRPSGTAWGLSGELQEAIALLRSVGAEDGASTKRKISLHWPKSAATQDAEVRRRAKEVRRFQRSFEEIVESDTSLSKSIEVILVKGVACFVVYHAMINQSQTVPIGAVLSEPGAVAFVEKQLSKVGIRLWAREGGKNAETAD